MFINITKPIRSVFVGTTLVAAMFTHVPAEAETINTPASVCQPANIGQAQRFNLGWSAYGVTNNSSAGSGDSFFIVCPLITSQAIDSVDTLYVEAQYLEFTFLSIKCSLFEVDTAGAFPHYEDGINISSFLTQNIFGSFPQHIDQTIDLTAHFGLTITDDMMTLICEMPPQTRINFFALEGV